MEEIINKKIVIETIGKQLEICLLPLGFKFVKSKQHLIRKYKGGFDRILLFTQTGYPYSHQELGISFMSRIDEVENIIEKFYDGRFRNMEFAKISHTNYIDYNELKKKDDKTFYTESYLNCGLCKEVPTLRLDNEFILHNEKDIQLAASFLQDFIKLRAISFFEHSKNINSLNVESKKVLINSDYGLGLMSIMKSLVLMKICKDNDYNTLLPIYKERMLAMDGFKEDSENALYEISKYLDENF